MTTRSGYTTRRVFLARLLSGVALPLGLVALPSGRSLAAPGCGDETPGMTVTLGRAGDRCLHLLIEDRRLVLPPPTEVPSKAVLDWTPDPDDRFGGRGSLDGVAGNFSGLRHSSAAQLFFPWPVQQGAVPAILDPARTGDAEHLPADLPETWQVSVDGVPTPVVQVFRKSVPIRTDRTAPDDLAHDQRHLIAFVLDAPLPDGARISVSAPALDLADMALAPEFASEAVHVCHAGYPVDGPKKAYVGLWLGVDRDGLSGTTDPFLSEATKFRLVDTETGAVVAEGQLAPAKPADEPHFDEMNFNGCDIYLADFSTHQDPGTYRVEVAGVGASVAFTITENPYAEALRLAARWYFHQRSGCAIQASHGEGRTRPRNGHPEDGLTVWQTDVQLGRTSEGFRREPYASRLLGRQPRIVANPDAWGGWHDAGDWDRRIQHTDAIYRMAQIVEMFDVARGLNLNIPESGRVFADPAVAARKSDDDRGDGATVLPDLVHEALWGLSLWRRTQTPDGGIIGGVEYSLDGIAGSVSWNPLQRAYAYAPEDWAAYRFVQAAAKLGHVIATVCGDEVLGAALVSEAEAAWDWAEAQLASGSAGDDPRTIARIDRARVRASGVLYRASGHQGARAVFEQHNPFHPLSEDESLGTRRGDLPYPANDYALAGTEGRKTVPEITAAITAWTESMLDHQPRIGTDYGLHNTAKYPWGLGWFRFGPGANWRAAEAGLVRLVTGETSVRIRDLVIEGMWFGLGCNPSNTSFVQGLGQRDFADPLTKDLERSCKVPGQICFGVAGGEMRDFEARKLSGAIHPAKQADWPRYAQIFESSSAILCAEHGIKSNAMEWLFACAFASEILTSPAPAD